CRSSTTMNCRVEPLRHDEASETDPDRKPLINADGIRNGSTKSAKTRRARSENELGSEAPRLGAERWSNIPLLERLNSPFFRAGARSSCPSCPSCLRGYPLPD